MPLLFKCPFKHYMRVINSAIPCRPPFNNCDVNSYVNEGCRRLISQYQDFFYPFVFKEKLKNKPER